ncbi:hypothetical protein GCK32_013732 [Trichostrongylus colubriformis]|uniref:Uncharacterized protein n=1 Tax=Trichostrongylus colubriformis TaxID=6319 RepID=A0AAN8F010_TRICO
MRMDSREAVVRLPYQRLIRRPINLLVPLELEDGISERRDVNTNTREKREDQATLSDRGNQEEQDPPEPRYNLRSRRKVNNSENTLSQFGNLFTLSLFSQTMLTTLYFFYVLLPYKPR